MRTARSRTSGEYLLALPMDPSSQEIGSPGNLGRFIDPPRLHILHRRVGRDEGRTVMPIAGGRPRKLVNGFAHVWEPSGKHLYYCVTEAAGGTRLQSIG